MAASSVIESEPRAPSLGEFRLRLFSGGTGTYTHPDIDPDDDVQPSAKMGNLAAVLHYGGKIWRWQCFGNEMRAPNVNDRR